MILLWVFHFFLIMFPCIFCMMTSVWPSSWFFLYLFHINFSLFLDLDFFFQKRIQFFSAVKLVGIYVSFSALSISLTSASAQLLIILCFIPLNSYSQFSPYLCLSQPLSLYLLSLPVSLSHSLSLTSYSCIDIFIVSLSFPLIF